MTSPNPFIPAEAGSQCFGKKSQGLGLYEKAAIEQMAQAWVPASAGMSGQDQ